jgi:hypothetical protein
MKSSVSVAHTHRHTQTVTEATRHDTEQTTAFGQAGKNHYQIRRCVATAEAALAAGTAGKLRQWRCGRSTNAATAAASRLGSTRHGSVYSLVSSRADTSDRSATICSGEPRLPTFRQTIINNVQRPFYTKKKKDNNKQKVLGRTNRLLFFDSTRTAKYRRVKKFFYRRV